MVGKLEKTVQVVITVCQRICLKRVNQENIRKHTVCNPVNMEKNNVVYQTIMQ
jgi:hypothetical protein